MCKTSHARDQIQMCTIYNFIHIFCPSIIHFCKFTELCDMVGGLDMSILYALSEIDDAELWFFEILK